MSMIGCSKVAIRVWLASQAGDVTERLESTDVLDVRTAREALTRRPLVLTPPSRLLAA